MQRRILRWAFWAATFATVVMASLPHPPDMLVSPHDKILHLVAFSILTIMGMLAFPRPQWPNLVLGLIAVGAAIELVQAIPALRRDADIWDWVADSAAVLTFVGLFEAIRRVQASRSDAESL